MAFLTVVEPGEIPQVEFVGEIHAEQPCGQGVAVITVWAVEDKAVVTSSVAQPQLSAAQCRQLADYMVTAARNCEHEGTV